MISFYVNPNVLMLAYALLLFSLALVLVCLTLSLSLSLPVFCFASLGLFSTSFRSFFWDLKSANMLFSTSFPTVRLDFFLLFPSFRLDFETPRRQRRRLLQVTTERRRQRLPGSVLSNSNSIWPHSLLRFHPLQLRFLSLSSSSSRRRSTNCNQVPKIMLRFVRSFARWRVCLCPCVCEEGTFSSIFICSTDRTTSPSTSICAYIGGYESYICTFILGLLFDAPTQISLFLSFASILFSAFLPPPRREHSSTLQYCSM